MPYIPVGERPLAFLDTETTGLDPHKQEIIEIAIIREWSNGRMEEWETKVKPQHIETAHPRALTVNGYADHPEDWDDAPLFDDVAATIVAQLDGCVIVGQNPKFDLGFLQVALERCGNPGRLPYHAIDTVTLAFEHLVPKGLTSLSFDNIRKFLGWSSENAHTALQDTKDCRRLFHELARPPDEEVDRPKLDERASIAIGIVQWLLDAEDLDTHLIEEVATCLMHCDTGDLEVVNGRLLNAGAAE